MERSGKPTVLGPAEIVDHHFGIVTDGSAITADAALIGVNNRNLKTFEVDLSTTEELAQVIPSTVILVAESGIRSPADAERMRRAGADALLVGESLARSGGKGLADLQGKAARGHRPL